MKKVFPSGEQTIHVWAQQSQSEGRCSNVFFENTKVLYSYGYHFPLAVFLDDKTVLINQSNYSVTTSKQQSYVRGATSHKKRLYVTTDIIKLIIYFQEHGLKKIFKKDLVKLVSEKVNGVVKVQARTAAKRRKKELIKTDIGEAETIFNEYNKLLQFFGFKMPVATVRLVDNLVNNHVEVVAKFAKLHKLEVAKKERVRKQHEKENLIKAAAAIERWKCGCNMDYNEINTLRNIRTVYMRPDGDRMKTTHGAQFPKDHAIKAFQFIVDCVENKAEWKTNGHTINLGHFHIDKIDSKGNVTAGCHYVEFAEIERNAKMLGLIEPDLTNGRYN